MYQIIKKDIRSFQKRVLIDPSGEVIEFSNRDEAEKLCAILNINSSNHEYSVKDIFKKDE